MNLVSQLKVVAVVRVPNLHETIDPIIIMAEFILSAQKIISRTIDPVKQAVFHLE